MPKEKPVKFTRCRICFKELDGKQRQFCSESCRIQNHQLKKKFEELKKENPNLELLVWNEIDTQRKKLAWNKIKGVENKPFYKTIRNIVTQKKPKGALSEFFE